ncbi:MAG: hypothetical protein FWE09_06485, partial [Treponema sp.]|nr:hypothetical protein [Treponema sp.]
MKNKSMAFAFVLMATIAGLAGAQQGGSDALPTLSWSGPWSQSGENRFVSNAIGHGGETWQMLTINAPAGGRLWVTLTASSEADFDFGIASALNGARSASEYQIRVSGAESETLLYDLPPGSHVIHFGYAKDNSVNSRNDRVTVEVEVSAPGVSVAPTLSWSGPWSRSGENRFVSDAIGHDQETWQTLTI